MSRAIAAAQLTQHLSQAKQAGLSSLYVVHGDEILLVQEALDALRQTAKAQGFEERQVFVASATGFDWADVQVACASQSLFAQKSLVEIHLPSGKPGKMGATALQQLAQAAQANAHAQACIQIVVLPQIDWQSQQSAWYSALMASSVSVTVQTVSLAALPVWIAQRMAKQDQFLPSGPAGAEAMAFLVGQVEGNLLAAHQEIEKLRLLYPAGEINLTQLQTAVLNVARYNVFDLPAAVWDGQLGRVNTLLLGLEAEGVSPVLVHFSLAEDVRLLWQLAHAMQSGKPMPLALREFRVRRDKEKRFERVLMQANASKINQWVLQAHQVDGVIKGLREPGLPVSPWKALLQWMQNIATSLQSRPPSPKLNVHSVRKSPL